MWFVWCESLIVRQEIRRGTRGTLINMRGCRLDRSCFRDRNASVHLTDADAGTLRKGGTRETDSEPEEHHELRLLISTLSKSCPTGIICWKVAVSARGSDPTTVSRMLLPLDIDACPAAVHDGSVPSLNTARTHSTPPSQVRFPGWSHLRSLVRPLPNERFSSSSVFHVDPCFLRAGRTSP